jgi:hypothetical protein
MERCGPGLGRTGWRIATDGLDPETPGRRPAPTAGEDKGQGRQDFIEADRKDGKRITGYESAVRVTSIEYEILALSQLYRDRADAENAFDEQKNQWGWGGFVPHDLARCQLAARTGALVYNWWSLFVRLAHPEARLEAITSRPWLMAAVGYRTERAGQITLTLTALHAHFAQARAMPNRVSALLQGWAAQTSEQLHPPTVWQCVCNHLKQTLARIPPPSTAVSSHIMLTESANYRF